MKRSIAVSAIIFVALFLIPVFTNAETIEERLSGRILLQVEDNGEAWYVYPNDLKRYYLGRPYDAWNIMRSLGQGITNADLAQIPTDSDSWDGPEGMIDRLKGYILLQVEDNGEAWYVSPVNGKRYYLGRPDDAFSVMRFLGLGATTSDIFQIYPNIKILNIHYDGTGWAEPDEYVEILNLGQVAQTFNTWTISDDDSHTFEFPYDYTLQPGQSTRVYTNQGDMNFGNSRAIWNNDGDICVLRGANGALIDVYSY